MKKCKYLAFVFSLLLVVMAGCDYNKFQIELSTPKSFTLDQPSPIQIKIQDSDSNPVVGAKVTVDLKMKGMSHGNLSIEMQETKDGVYVGNADIEMEGDYTASIIINDKGEKWMGEKRFSIVTKTSP
ncbi:FixH family protein [Neobacillus dielmonensis]|uniref:FixH family protein n=1 Tax=Neobacillus dielmonensis TaxID=1347369 RepID=UPI0005AB36BC|nr:FixH family protein [Neobacillus dielmonensis]